VRIEREHDRRAIHIARLGQQPLDDPGVAAMDAVEIADRDRAAANVGRQVVERAEETPAKWGRLLACQTVDSQELGGATARQSSCLPH
jgi:hypothetical protein